jgi:hypothetical protein
MIKIYHVSLARSLRIPWLMEELGEPYEVEAIAFPPDAGFLAISPTGTLPTIVDGDIVMAESIAILQYLTGRRLQRSMELGLGRSKPRPRGLCRAPPVPAPGRSLARRAAQPGLAHAASRTRRSEDEFHGQSVPGRVPAPAGGGRQTTRRWTAVSDGRAADNRRHLGRLRVAPGATTRSRGAADAAHARLSRATARAPSFPARGSEIARVATAVADRDVDQARLLRRPLRSGRRSRCRPSSS